jgi:hypothetical protein
MASTALITLGMAVTGTNVAAGAVVASIDSLTQVTVSKAHTGTITTQSITFTGDRAQAAAAQVRRHAERRDAIQRRHAGQRFATVTNVGTDEVAASGTYSAGGAALTNTTPVQTNPITSAAWSYSNSVSFTGATLSVIGAYIYNTTVRMGHSTFALAANRVVPGTTSAARSLSWPAR